MPPQGRHPASRERLRQNRIHHPYSALHTYSLAIKTLYRSGKAGTMLRIAFALPWSSPHEQPTRPAEDTVRSSGRPAQRGLQAGGGRPLASGTSSGRTAARPGRARATADQIWANRRGAGQVRNAGPSDRAAAADQIRLDRNGAIKGRRRHGDTGPHDPSPAADQIRPGSIGAIEGRKLGRRPGTNPLPAMPAAAFISAKNRKERRPENKEKGQGRGK